MIQHFLEERFHKAVRFFAGVVGESLEIKGNLTVAGDVTVGGSVNVDEGFKEYACSLVQTGTGAPSVKVLKNTLSASIVWTRAGVGTYTGTLTGAFPAGKVQLFPPPFNVNALATDVSYALIKASANAVTLYTFFEGALADDLLTDDQVISIKVWN